MCGRFVLTAVNKQLKETFDALPEQLNVDSKANALENSIVIDRYNIAPTQMIAAVRQFEDERTVSGLKWGLVPAWAKDPRIGNQMINARAETVAEKPSFRSAFKSRRCIIPASGFYEWRREARAGKGAKQPFYFYLTDEPIFGFAGLWEAWSDNHTGAALDTCTIITTQANEVLTPVHDRMPVILKPQDYDLWLDPENKDAENLLPLLAPYPAEEMSSHPVSRDVNSTSANSAVLIEKLNSL